MDYIFIKLPLQVIYRHNAVPNVYAYTCNIQGMYMYMCTCHVHVVGIVDHML